IETDLAIDGEGFFTVKDKAGNLFYTRAGQFVYDKSGFLTSQDGKTLQIKDIDPDTMESVGPLRDINILDQIDSPTPTGDGLKEGEGVTIKANLNSNAKVPGIAVDLNNVQVEMYNFSTAVTVFDNKGNERSLNVVFRKQPDQPEQIDPTTNQPIPGTEVKNVWQWLVLAPGEIIEGGVPGVMTAKGGGYMQFSDDGRLVANIPGNIEVPPLPPDAPAGSPPNPPTLVPQPVVEGQPNQVSFNFIGSGMDQIIGFNFGKGSNP
ncbi:MAG: flagellar hook-basal body complex protein, partial [Proteobacteria bacterium]|nr:flagellar hook-basal body complex protein [Pseudomonadota bacterium]